MAKISFYLDSRRLRKDGMAQLMLAVNHEGRTCYVPTGHYFDPEQWEDNRPIPEIASRVTMKIYNSLTKMLARAQEVTSGYVGCEGVVTAKMIRDVVARELFPERVRTKERKRGLLWCIDRFMSQKEGRTRELYAATRKKVDAFVGGREVSLEDVSCDWLGRFDAALAETSPSRNARGIHLRNIRAVVNWAIDEGLTNNYPFRRYKIKGQPTKKRALSVESLRRVLTADLSGLWFEHYRDFFALSFYLIGMNTVDLCGLRGLSGEGRVDYFRAKTHKAYSVKLEPEAARIIERYRGEVYLFGDLDRYGHYRNYCNELDRGLKAMSAYLNGEDTGLGLPGISMYWARHSWATIAASLDIPKETIAAALGHGGNTVTDIYIDFDRRKVDEANRRVIDWVLYGRR